MLKYRRAPIETESPEEYGYENIRYNLSESSVTDARFQDLDISLDDVVLLYGDHLGKSALREMIAAEGDNLNADHVMLTVGAAGALFIIATSLLGPDDRVVVAHPNYSTNLETPRAIGCAMDYLPLRFDDRFQLDIDQLAEKITPSTKLVSLTNPHNPTGTVMSAETLQQIVELVEASNAYLLVDETYREMNFGRLPPLAASLSPRVISVSSLSKTYGLPGIRLGWLICQAPGLMERFLAAKEQIHITNSVIDEEIAYRFLLRKPTHFEGIKAHIEANLAIIKEWMAHQEVMEWIEPQGGVVCFPRIRADVPIDLETFYDLLTKKYKTYVGPGSWFEFDRRYMRLGYGWPTGDALRKGLESIQLAIQESQSDAG